jgi:hypothetical protein
MAITPERAEMLARAMVSNLDGWLEELAVIEARAIPGNKAALLHLMTNMTTARNAILHVLGGPQL